MSRNLEPALAAPFVPAALGGTATSRNPASTFALTKPIAALTVTKDGAGYRGLITIGVAA